MRTLRRFITLFNEATQPDQRFEFTFEARVKPILAPIIAADQLRGYITHSWRYDTIESDVQVVGDLLHVRIRGVMRMSIVMDRVPTHLASTLEKGVAYVVRQDMDVGIIEGVPRVRVKEIAAECMQVIRPRG